MDYKIVLIGVGHVFDIGEKIKEIILQEKPNAVAVELDYKRLDALLNPKRKKGLGIYQILALTQSIMAKKFGVVAGGEMLAAVKQAQDMMIPVICMDMDAFYVVNKLWRSLSFKKKITIFISLFLSLFMKKKMIEKEINKISNDNFIEEFEKSMPELKKILIDERNQYMCEKLLRNLDIYDKIVAVVGEGHIKGMKKILEEHTNIKVIHLRELMK